MVRSNSQNFCYFKKLIEIPNLHEQQPKTSNTNKYKAFCRIFDLDTSSMHNNKENKLNQKCIMRRYN